MTWAALGLVLVGGWAIWALAGKGLLAHLVYAFGLAAFNGYLARAMGPTSSASSIVTLVVLVGGVWLLGWWALLSYLVGFAFGGWLYFSGQRRAHAAQERQIDP